MLEDKDGICGYVLGALDSAAFYERMKSEWFPKMRAIYPTIPGKIIVLHFDCVESDGKYRDGEIIQDFHIGETHFPESFAPYPSHLHIDLLPRAQRKGLGTKMIQHLERELLKRGSKGVHLEMSPKNHSAFAFYTTLGFKVLERQEDALYLGKKLE